MSSRLRCLFEDSARVWHFWAGGLPAGSVVRPDHHPRSSRRRDQLWLSRSTGWQGIRAGAREYRWSWWCGWGGVTDGDSRRGWPAGLAGGAGCGGSRAAGRVRASTAGHGVWLLWSGHRGCGAGGARGARSASGAPGRGPEAPQCHLAVPRATAATWVPPS